jgi:hypothetical protein
MLCAPGLVFGRTEGVGSLLHVLRSRTHFRRYRGRRLPFSSFARPDSFLAVSRESDPVFMYWPGLVFGRTEGVRSRFHVLRTRTHFLRYRGRRVPFSYFARPDSISAVLRASGPVYMFCAPGLVFGGTDGVGFRFHVLRARTCFLRYRGRRVPFSFFARPHSCSTVPRASGPIFIFLRSQTRFRPYRGRRVPFTCLALPDTFSAITRESAVPRSRVPFSLFCAPGLVFGRTEDVGSRFQVLRSQTRFRRYRGRRVPFSCFARPDSFLAVPRASGPVYMFCAPGIVFGVRDVVGSRFHVLCSRTRFGRYEGRQVPFSCIAR